MNESEFHIIADEALSRMFEVLEHADAAGDIEVEYQDGVMTIEMEDGRQFIVSKHTPSRQLWLSSPVSGGFHFGHDAADWKLGDGRTLAGILSAELRALAKIEVTF